MYRFLVLFLVLSATRRIWGFDDYYEVVTQRTRNFGNHRNGQFTEERSGNAHARHTHAHTRDTQFQRLRNPPTTVKNYIDSSSANAKVYFNTSEKEVDKNNNNKRKSQDDGGMVYPSDIEHLSNSADQIKSSACSFGLCDEVDNYPIEKIQRILRQSELKKFFSEEVIVVNNRFGEEGDNLCATVSQTRFPKTAKNIHDKEQVIVNVDQYKQGVEFETCSKDGGPCDYAENFPNNFTPRCVQKYTVRKLMVVGKESDDTVFDYFKIPSCCVCTVKK